MEAGVGLIKALETDASFETGLQNDLGVGVLAQLQFPLATSVVPLLHCVTGCLWQPVRSSRKGFPTPWHTQRHYLAQLPQRAHVIRATKMDPHGDSPPGLSECAVKNLF